MNRFPKLLELAQHWQTDSMSIWPYSATGSGDRPTHTWAKQVGKEIEIMIDELNYWSEDSADRPELFHGVRDDLEKLGVK